MTEARLVAVVLSCLTLGVAGCGGSSGGNGGGGAAAKNITISATLNAGTVTSALIVESSALSVSSPLTSFAGYKLYCVTFSTPPVSGSAAADTAGSVSLTLAAQNVPFGCFILDTHDKAAATLMFTKGAQNGQTLTSGADTNLGTITVDTISGVAQAVIPSGGTLGTTTPVGAPCPVGTWNFVTTHAATSGSCSGSATATAWIAQSGPGTYTMSILAKGIMQQLSATYANGVFTAGPFTPVDPGLPSCAMAVTATMTVNASCTGMSGTLNKSNCTASCCCDTEPIIVTKQ